MLLLVLVFLVIAAFSVDGMRLFVERRGAQSAADAAALAAALSICEGADPSAAALARAADNGFLNDGVSNEVVVAYPPLDGPYAGDDSYVSVDITAHVSGSLIRLVYTGPLVTTARAVAYCNLHEIGSQSALFAGSNSCQNSLEWSSSQTIVIGGVHSNHDIRIGGQQSRIEGAATYVTDLQSPPGQVTYLPAPPANPVQVPAQPYPVALETWLYAPGGPQAVTAETAGRYYSRQGDIDLGWLESQGLYNPSTNSLEAGLYYASGSIDLNSNRLLGEGVTLVARDRITLSGSSHYLYPYLDGLLAFSDAQRSGGSQCNTPIIRLSGSQHVWYGLLFAPAGQISISGASNLAISGSLIGNTISLSGSEISIAFEPAYLSPRPPTVGLAE